MAAKDTASHLSPSALEVAFRHQTAQAAHLKLSRRYAETGDMSKSRHYLELAAANAKVQQRMKELDRIRMYARDGVLDDYRRQQTAKKENALD